MNEQQTWYVLEDGSAADPSEVTSDAKGVLRHKDGMAVQMRGDVPRSRGVDPEQERKAKSVTKPSYKAKPAAAAEPQTKEMKAAEPKFGYLTRGDKTD